METTLKQLSRNVRMKINGGATGDRAKMDEWQQDAAYDGRSYSLTLFYKGRRMTVNFFQGKAHTEPPTVEAVLDCLLSDASGIFPQYGGGTFEDWAAEYGYDTDSRKAERIFHQCELQSMKLYKMLGKADFEQFMQADRN